MSKQFHAGMLVQRSSHWCEQHDGRQEDQLGIVVDCQIEEEDGLLWPDVHWEGEPMPTWTHPDIVEPVDRTGLRITYRDG